MKIKVTIDNLINLVSNFLIRLRTEELTSSNNLYEDLINFVEYLEKYSNDNDEVLFDKDFITSKNEQGKLNEAINPKISEIKDFKELLLKMKNNPTDNVTNIEITKEHLRKIAASFISLKNKSNY
jgi:site-specific recombinase XerD